ncbi:capsid assembly protein [Magnetospirillum moscoviense]|uniref:Scaffolding protein n=1 Tax=Magnetospirillum moscoviense TaxID=1437059 RepID=A0A178MPG6_9PROT|nr:hypothetical protein [Magnetospirillum moscoviense]OAN50690.1 hypothetical protein A6A05_11840 [Magnetospirillum moscoviense]
MADIAITAPEAPAAPPAAEAPPPAAPATPPQTPAAPPPAPAGRVVRYGDKDLDVPEQFWDGQGLNTEAVLKANADMRAKLSAIPKVPDAYDLAAALPAEAKDSFADLLDEKAPLRGEFLDGLKANGFSEAQVKFMLGMAAKRDAMLGEELKRLEAEATSQAVAEAVKVLGSEDKVRELQAWFGQVLGLSANETAIIPATALPKLNALRLSLAGGAVAPGGNTALPPSITRDDVRKMMADKDYLTNPAKQKQVRDFYSRTYGDDGDMKGVG